MVLAPVLRSYERFSKLDLEKQLRNHCLLRRCKLDGVAQRVSVCLRHIVEHLRFYHSKKRQLDLYITEKNLLITGVLRCHKLFARWSLV